MASDADRRAAVVHFADGSPEALAAAEMTAAGLLEIDHTGPTGAIYYGLTDAGRAEAAVANGD